MITDPHAEQAQTPVAALPAAGAELPDALLDDLGLAFRRLRRSIVRPPYVDVPVPSLGRPLAIAKVLACRTIQELGELAPVVTVKDVAAALHLQHSTVSRLLGSVEAEGLLVRQVDLADRRRTTLVLTERGRAVVLDSMRLRRDLVRAVLAGWPTADVTALIALLTRLADCAAERLPALMDAADAGQTRDATEVADGVQFTAPTEPDR